MAGRRSKLTLTSLAIDLLNADAETSGDDGFDAAIAAFDGVPNAIERIAAAGAEDSERTLTKCC
jgi:hypothetical protein